MDKLAKNIILMTTEQTNWQNLKIESPQFKSLLDAVCAKTK